MIISCYRGECVAQALKLAIDQRFVEKLETALVGQWSEFKGREFREMVLGSGWAKLELKGRIHRISDALRQFGPQDYAQALKGLEALASQFTGLGAWVFPTFVERYGVQDWGPSLKALETFTQYSTGEFAVRPFFESDPERLALQMLAWSQHPNLHVRRLASEGMRPRLPWGRALVALKQDPSPCLPILENLKQDPELYVRKSVANHMNDIGKDHPHILLEIAQRWWGTHAHTDWIVKHALRSLLKAGHPQALKIVGLKANKKITLKKVSLSPKSVRLGGSLDGQVWVANSARTPQKIRVDFVLYFLRKNGDYGRKVFKVGEKVLEGPGVFKRRLSFKPMTTRKHLAGKHFLGVAINGVEQKKIPFQLKE